jgi:hypothetical protein
MLAPDYTHRFQSAVYLNNTAVTFMVHGEHRRAMEMLSDALMLIKSIVQSPESSLAVQKNASFAQAKVQTTQQRLARLSTKGRRKNHEVKVVHYDGSLDTSILLEESESDGNADHGVGIAVVINTVSHDAQDMAEWIQETAPAIMLSNFALSHWYAARSSTCTMMNDDMLDGSLHILSIARTVLGVSQRTMPVNEGNLLVAIVLAHNRCGIHEYHQDVLRLDDWFNANQEWCLLQELSLQLAKATSHLVPVAGAA